MTAWFRRYEIERRRRIAALYAMTAMAWFAAAVVMAKCGGAV